MLHPSNREQSQFEYRSRTDITKAKRSKGASLVTVSISYPPCVSRCAARQRSCGWPSRAEAGETISIAFSISMRLTHDRAHSLNTACSLKASSTVETKHCSDCL